MRFSKRKVKNLANFKRIRENHGRVNLINTIDDDFMDIDDFEEPVNQNDLGDEDISFKEFVSIDSELLTEIVEFILDGNCSKRSISVLVYAILRQYFLFKNK